MEDTKNFIKKVIPTGLWALAAIATSAVAFNTGNAFLIICGIANLVGVTVRLVKVTKESL